MVQLAEPEDEDDPKYFDNFAAEIMVKFRDNEARLIRYDTMRYDTTRSDTFRGGLTR